jgi:outer membrane lipoprotein SlyB
MNMKKTFCLIPVAFLAACAAPMPSGPAVMVLPGSGKSFDQFRFDDNECRQFASAQIGGQTPDQASSDAGGRSAALGAAVGGLAGAALGGNARGVVAGAALGTAGGAVAGSGAGAQSGRTLQQRYDVGYQQCMYAKGHQIPMASRYDRSSRPAPAPAASRPSVPPPPPPAGTPPPPPPQG